MFQMRVYENMLLKSLKKYFRSLCIKDQIGDVLAELMEIKNGLEACGISSVLLGKEQSYGKSCSSQAVSLVFLLKSFWMS